MAKYPVTNMTAKDLLNYLQNGATLESRWVYGKRLNILKSSADGTLYIQRSNISALIKAGALLSIELSGNNYLYRLTEAQNV